MLEKQVIINSAEEIKHYTRKMLIEVTLESYDAPIPDIIGLIHSDVHYWDEGRYSLDTEVLTDALNRIVRNAISVDLSNRMREKHGNKMVQVSATISRSKASLAEEEHKRKNPNYVFVSQDKIQVHRGEL